MKDRNEQKFEEFLHMVDCINFRALKIVFVETLNIFQDKNSEDFGKF